MGSVVTGLRWELSGQCSDWAKMETLLGNKIK